MKCLGLGMYPKKKRVVNKKLLESYRGRPCVVCGETKTTVAHHVKTKGAGGDDVESNLLALCFVHHRLAHDGNLEKTCPELFRLIEKVRG